MSFEYSGYDSEEEYQRALDRHKIGHAGHMDDPGIKDVLFWIGVIAVIALIWSAF